MAKLTFKLTFKSATERTDMNRHWRQSDCNWGYPGSYRWCLTWLHGRRRWLPVAFPSRLQSLLPSKYVHINTCMYIIYFIIIFFPSLFLYFSFFYDWFRDFAPCLNFDFARQLPGGVPSRLASRLASQLSARILGSVLTLLRPCYACSFPDVFQAHLNFELESRISRLSPESTSKSTSEYTETCSAMFHIWARRWASTRAATEGSVPVETDSITGSSRPISFQYSRRHAGSSLLSDAIQFQVKAVNQTQRQKHPNISNDPIKRFIFNRSSKIVNRKGFTTAWLHARNMLLNYYQATTFFSHIISISLPCRQRLFAQCVSRFFP